MDVHSLTITKIFSGGGDAHYVLPHFQREYAWEKENWKTLLDDIFEIYEIYDEQSPPEHFLGALVVINEGTRRGTINTYKLVDGQQRLTTISILLCALAELCQTDFPELTRKIARFLVNQDEEGDLRYKLLPTEKYKDRETYKRVVDGKLGNYKTESKIDEAYRYFYDELNKRLFRNRQSPETFFLVVANCLHVVFISLDKREKPFEIFESLNAKGKALSQADLVRNYIAMRLPEHDQIEVFNDYWSQIEDMLRENRTVARIGELSAFLRHYLGIHMRAVPNKEHIYARFRDRMEREFGDHSAFVAELKKLHRYAVYYNMFLRPETTSDTDLTKALTRLNIIEATTAYPLMLAFFGDYETGVIERNTLLQALTVLENYLLRRYLAGEPTNYHNKMFPLIYPNLDPKEYVISLKRTLLARNYPSDAVVVQRIVTQPFYERNKSQRTVLVLEALNRYLSQGSGGYTVLDGNATVEHIMPQTLTPEWQRMLGENAGEIHNQYLHTLGNLTLVTQGWNSELSNGSFSHKLAKFRQHALKLNAAYFQDHAPIWNEETIQARAQAIGELVVQVWERLGETVSATSLASKSYSGKTPVSITFLGDARPAESWRDVAIQTVEAIISLVGQEQFEVLAEEFSADISRQPRTDRARWKHLSNDWWLHINMSANSVVNFCLRLVRATDGLSDEDWAVQTLED